MTRALILNRFITSLFVAGICFAPAVMAAPSSLSSSKKATITKMKKTLKKKGVVTLPSASKSIKSVKKKSSAKSSGVGIAEASGTPPTLTSIAGSGVKNLFWRSGVIDAIASGTPSQNQCGEMYYGVSDGFSGGFGACHMAEGVGYAFQNILQSETSLCYMKRFPTTANMAAGGVSVVEGSLPAGGISGIFAPPSGSTSRIVKVNIAGESEEQGGSQNVFFKVYSDRENSSARKLYRADLWFCDASSNVITGYNKLSINTSGKFESEEQNAESEGRSFYSAVEGFLTLSGSSITWDTSKSRKARSEGMHSGSTFKSEVEITPTNKIKVKSYDTFGGGTRKSFTINSFTGSDALSVRFTEGAFKENHGNGGPAFEGATEYRSTYYAAAPESTLLSSLSDVNFDTDSFYQSGPAFEDNISDFSCNVTPDLELNLDMSNSVVAASVAVCESNRLDNMHFCHDDTEVRAAQQQYHNVCRGGN
jgi:hypothetical protein